MNFDPFWAVNQNSDLLWAKIVLLILLLLLLLLKKIADYFVSFFFFDISFWTIALPILAIVTPLALLSDLKNIWMYFQHRGDSKKAIKVCRVRLIFFFSPFFFEYYLWIVNWSKKFFLSSLINEHDWGIPRFDFRDTLPPRFVVKKCLWIPFRIANIAKFSNLGGEHDLFSIYVNGHKWLVVNM